MTFESDPLQSGGITECLFCTTCEEKPDGKKTVDHHSFADCPILATNTRLEAGRLMRYVFNRSSAFAYKIASNEADCQHTSKLFVEIIMTDIRKNKKMKYLVKNIQNIEVEFIVRKTVETIMKSITGMVPPVDHIHIAPTQSGKSAFKALKIYVNIFMNVSVIVVTKGKGESIELRDKISSFLSGSPDMTTDRIFSPYKSNPVDIDRAFMTPDRACVLIIPCTYQKIQYAEDILTRRLLLATGRGRNFRTDNALFLDEADSTTNRSESNTERNEVALERFMALLKPSVTKVTATPIPILLPILLGDDDLQVQPPIITTLCKKTENYVGIENVVNEDLDQDSLHKGFSFPKFKPQYEVNDQKGCGRFALWRKCVQERRNKFPDIVSRNNPTIPKMNDQCIAFLRKEIEKEDKYQLILVDTCAWVNAKTRNKEGIFHQAAGTQDYFFTKENMKFVAIVVHADNIYYRHPGHKYGFKCKSFLGDLLDEIDPNISVVIFGYNGMKRTRSFRSDDRVPSSMILCLGRGQSNENCRQAAGRLTFKGRNILQRNHKTNKVLLLCPKDDFEIIQSHDPLVKKMITLLGQMELSPDERRSEFHSSKHNYLHNTERKTGNYCITAGVHQNVNTRTLFHQASKHTANDTVTDCTVIAATGPNTVPNSAIQCNRFATKGATVNDDDNNSSSNSNEKPNDPTEEVFCIFAPPGKLGLGIIKRPKDGIPAVVCTVKDSSPLVGKVQVEDKVIAVDDENVLTLMHTDLLTLLNQKSMNQIRKLTILRTTAGIISPNSMSSNRHVQSEENMEDKDGRRIINFETKSMVGVQIARTDNVNTARSDDEGQGSVRNEPSRPVSDIASLSTIFDTTVSNETKKSVVLGSNLMIAKKRKSSSTQDKILVSSSKKSNTNRRMTNNLILSSKTINDSFTIARLRKRSTTEDTTITPLSNKESCGGKNEQYDIIDLTADNTEIDDVAVV